MWWWFLACGSESPAGPCLLPGFGDESGRLEGFTAAHNVQRARVGVPPLLWDPALAQVSADWLDHLALNRGCALEHDWSSPLGENLAWNSGFDSTPCRVVEGWAAEEADYDLATNSCSGEDCGHWTQLVWSTSTHVGCAVRSCRDGAEAWMCNYDPPGNIVGLRPYD
jgi:pathogenesis-related protein 1